MLKPSRNVVEFRLSVTRSKVYIRIIWNSILMETYEVTAVTLLFITCNKY